MIENEVACICDDRMDYNEERWISFGFVHDRLFVCAYAMRGDVYRLIPVRPATKAEHRAIDGVEEAMATVKVTKKLAREAAKDIDWKQLDAMSGVELESAARMDTDNPTLIDRELKRLAVAAMVRRLRRRTGLSQIGFARRYKVPVATLRDWEQGRRMPETTALTYLIVIDRMPDEVHEALMPQKSRRRQRAA